MLYDDLVQPGEYICHHGIKGQRWGIRRYQNEDGSLTELGRKRLGMDESKVSDRLSRDSDIIIKKGTKINRWVSDSLYEDDYIDELNKFRKTHNGKNPSNSEYEEINKKIEPKSLNRIDKKEKEYAYKHYSVDSIEMNNLRYKGENFYASWFLNNGWEPYGKFLDTFTVKEDIRVASGKKVADTALKYMGNVDKSIFKNKEGSKTSINFNRMFKDFSMGSDVWNKTINDLKNQGYDAIDDIHDLDTNLPIIGINLDSSIMRQRRITGMEWINKYAN